MAVVLSVGEVCYAAVGKLTQDPTLLATGIEQVGEEGIRDSRLWQVSWGPCLWRAGTPGCGRGLLLMAQTCNFLTGTSCKHHPSQQVHYPHPGHPRGDGNHSI